MTRVSMAEANAQVWRRNRVDEYTDRPLRPAEVVVLARYGSGRGRVLELGCGAGRVLRYLLLLGNRQVVGVDISPDMVEHCRAAHPQADVRQGDMREIDAILAPGQQFDAILIPDNTLDVIAFEDRCALLAKLGERLAPDGVLVFSSHNLALRAGWVEARTTSLLDRIGKVSLESVARFVVSSPRRQLNKRRLGRLDTVLPGYAILNDEEGDWGSVHVNVRHAQQREQLEAVGLQLVECIDAYGFAVEPGEDGRGPWLYYVARRRETA